MAWWLVACAVMVFVMVVLGGATRLTHSGLSMVEWNLHHILPPLTNAEWREQFQAYQTSPEYREVNSWMEVEDFKEIFWLEYIHRLWGRLIGVVFAVPFVVFLIQKRIDKPLGLKLVGLFALGGLQGLIGWLMVASGLVDKPAVSHYRLAAHLITAFITYGAIVWVALDLFRRAGVSRAFAPDKKLARRANGTVGAILLVVVWGALVAGLHAGLIYNTFPLMDGKLIPSGLSSPFSDVMTVQFTHRVLAILLVVKIVGMWLRSRKAPLAPTARTLTNAILAMAFVQAALGISTLLLVVPLPLALAHQTGALILFTLGICLTHELSPATHPREG
jgi:cytochrome c oxidase assembly protein subunit 15